MKIAVTHENGQIFQHFGHTEQFKVYTVAEGKILTREVVDTNGSGHGALAGMLSILEVEALICGGIGAGAQMALADVKDTNEGGYDTKVVGYYYVRNGDGTYTKTALGDGEVKYSRFNETQLGDLKSYANIVKELDDIVLDIFAIKA